MAKSRAFWGKVMKKPPLKWIEKLCPKFLKKLLDKNSILGYTDEADFGGARNPP
jgi:hypothetical protein